MDTKCETGRSGDTRSPQKGNAPADGRKNRNRTWLIAGIAVLAAVLAVVLIVTLAGKSYIGSIDELHEVPELEKTFFDAVDAAANFDYDRFMTFFYPVGGNAHEGFGVKEKMKGMQEDFQNMNLRLKGLQVESAEFRGDENSCREFENDIREEFSAEVRITNTCLIRFTVSYETDRESGKEEITVPFLETDGKWYIDPGWRAQ